MASQVPLVSANLATVCIESFMFGIFFILSLTSGYLLVRRNSMPFKSSTPNSGSIFQTPMFLAGTCLFVTVTAHWMLTVTRLFQAFVLYNDGSAPLSFYGDLSQLTEIVKTGFLMASLIVGDAMIIYRLWVIWNHSVWVIVFPLCTLLGLTVCGIGITYQFTQYTPGENVFLSQAGRWITSDCVFTLCTNVYSTAMIAWKVWNTNIRARRLGGGSLLPILATFVESAALYTSWTIFFFASYQSHSNIQFTAVDIWCTVSGISFMLINVRVGLGWAQKAHQNSSSSAHGPVTSQQSGEERRAELLSMRPLAVNITHVVDHDGVYDPETYKHSAGDGGDSLGAICR
ncbi:hypothetical protein BJ138DRAFT_1163063 [Hygrophoropsis aurantiaca]|uniref:Uncharacterized protein n=1 Tax=Hygrophoropsis aurantiaca TaxID=72124 RepID=A0ACB7ZZT9_9AGAM|nr:hypothetical protein BJ138DRAFT_1163063 [Hygrophoropsis aurantiaca]